MENIIDFHSHVLPGIDDGSASVEESLEMLRAQARQGFSHVVATPHFYAHYDSPEVFLERRAEALQSLRGALEADPELPQVSLGAEVYYFRGISDSDMLPALTMAGRPYILIEMPQAPWTESMYRDLEGIWNKHDIMPIIAHIDRYIRPLKTHHIPERLAELPVLVQANASFFLDSGTARMALQLLKKDRIHLLGSDAHNLRSRRPRLGEAVEIIERKLGSNALERICQYQEDVLFN